MARIRDVADRAGVSVATVSRVLNNNDRVRPHLRERVLKAIAGLNYEPSGIARSMRSQSVPLIGLIISDIQNPFFTALVRAVEDIALENQYRLILCNSDEDPRKEQLYTQVLITERVAGAIIVPTGHESRETLLNLRIPFVLIDRKVSGVVADTVVLDNIAGAYEATRHLIGLGHQRIGLVGASLDVSFGYERQRGYEQALHDHGIPIEESLIVICAGNSKASEGYRAASELLDRVPRPTALFAVNNLRTLGALSAIRERGLRIPQDISVIGFDDMPWLSLLEPPLTVVRQPTYEIGAEAARLLFRRLNAKCEEPAQIVVMQPEFVIRGSTAVLPNKG